MRIREIGSSAITALRSVDYMVKALLALLMGSFAVTRRRWKNHDALRISIAAAVAAVILSLVILELMRSRSCRSVTPSSGC
jgi:hypothetical protein